MPMERNELIFNASHYRKVSVPGLEVDSDGEWMAATLCKSIDSEARIVIWYGEGSCEGLPPSLPYRLSGGPLTALCDGERPWQLVDGDGEPIKMRLNPAIKRQKRKREAAEERARQEAERQDESKEPQVPGGGGAGPGAGLP